MKMDMYYWSICGCDGHFYYENICYRMTCPVGGNVLQVCAEAATIEAAVNFIYWWFLFHQCLIVVFFKRKVNILLTCLTNIFPELWFLK